MKFVFQSEDRKVAYKHWRTLNINHEGQGHDIFYLRYSTISKVFLKKLSMIYVLWSGLDICKPLHISANAKNQKRNLLDKKSRQAIPLTEASDKEANRPQAAAFAPQVFGSASASKMTALDGTT